MILDYKNKFVIGLCLLPTYLVIAISLSWVSVVTWMIGIVVMTVFCDLMYIHMVLKPLSTGIEQWKRYWLTFVGQILFWLVVISLGSIWLAE